MRAKSPAASPPANDADTRIVQALLVQGKIAAIKLCRGLQPGQDLAGAKRYVEQLEANLPASSRPQAGSCPLTIAALLTLAASAFL